MSAAGIKMDELLVNWLASDAVYESVLEWIENAAVQNNTHNVGDTTTNNTTNNNTTNNKNNAVLLQQLPAELQVLQLNSKNHMANAASSSDQSADQTTALESLSIAATAEDEDTGSLDDASDADSFLVGLTAFSSSTGGGSVIPPFYPVGHQLKVKRRQGLVQQHDTWEPLPAAAAPTPDSTEGRPPSLEATTSNSTSTPREAAAFSEATIGLMESSSVSPQPQQQQQQQLCARDAVLQIFAEAGQRVTNNGIIDGGIRDDDDDDEEDETDSMETDGTTIVLTLETFSRITKEVCHFPSYFNAPLLQRVIELWGDKKDPPPVPDAVTFEMIASFWATEMESHDAVYRFFRLVKQPSADHIVHDDFLPYIKSLLQDHPGLEFLSTHAEFQEKYAVTVIARIFYSVNRCHSGRITARQIRRSDLLAAFHQVDDEEDINKVTRYFSYEHFYVLYCRFWELDHDRDYRITREDLLKYGDHSLSHMIVDRIFDAAPRPFFTNENNNANSSSGGTNNDSGDTNNNNNQGNKSLHHREYLSYEDFIYFMLSEEDKSNDISVRYWFQCVDVDGDGKLNNMEMRSFYAVQLHRMQCMGHEIVPFEDMLCQMMDMIKPANASYIVAEDFLQPECSQVSGALFDALFNLNKYLMFEQRDPFVERQKREDEFSSDWDRFACIDYNRLAMEEEAREEEAMEIDWVTVDDEEDDDNANDGDATSRKQSVDADGSDVTF